MNGKLANALFNLELGLDIFHHSEEGDDVRFGVIVPAV